MKIIFLDIDGVLNTIETFREIYNEYKKTGIRRTEIDIKRVEYLKQIVDRTGALIVLSSSWRIFCRKKDGIIVFNSKKMQDLVNILASYGLFIYDLTPYDKKGIRQNEIKAWLNANKVESFVVIDDDSSDLQEFVPDRLIKTSNTKNAEMIKDMGGCFGLSVFHIEKAVNILNGKERLLEKH